MQRLINNFVSICVVAVAFGLLADYLEIILSDPTFIIDPVTNVKKMSGGRSEYPHIIAFLGILSNFLYALAASIFITFFITKKIDEHEGKRIHEELSELRNNINEDVFGAVFKSVMLDEIYDAVKKGVIANPLVRRDAVWIHDYRKDSNGRMCRKLTLQSKILNTSGSAYKDLFKIRVDSHDEGGEIVASILCKNHEEIIAKYLVTNPSENHNVFQDPENENILNVEINVGARAQVDIVIVTDLSLIHI